VEDAAILIDPDDVAAISDGIITLLNDHSLQSSYSQQAVKQAEKFTWHKCASQTLQLYENII
ncbi:MAG: glycosyltransferase family 1 protein, partial [Thiohalomonadales bacterium]